MKYHIINLVINFIIGNIINIIMNKKLDQIMDIKKNIGILLKKYDNFKHEVLNKDHINIEQFEHVTEKVPAYLPSNYVKALKSDTSYAEHYEIKPGTAITSEHLMSVLLWTDCSMLASTFSATFRYINSEETDKELKEKK
eukprot:544817_1